MVTLINQYVCLWIFYVSEHTELINGYLKELDFFVVFIESVMKLMGVCNSLM